MGQGEGAFALSQAMQNSLPSMSSIGMHASLPSYSVRTCTAPSGDQSCAFRLKCGEALFPQSGADPHIKMHPVLGRLPLGDTLEVQPRAHT